MPAGGTVDTLPCATNSCPNDCVGQWAEWGACDASCGNGTKSRFFNVAQPAAGGGRDCVATAGAEDVDLCSTNPCDVTTTSHPAVVSSRDETTVDPTTTVVSHAQDLARDPNMTVAVYLPAAYCSTIEAAESTTTSAAPCPLVENNVSLTCLLYTSPSPRDRG